MSIEAMKQALEALEFSDDFIGMKPYEHVAEEAADGHRNLLEAITALRQAIAEAEKQEPWKWFPAPVKTEWGHEMVVADLGIDKDHTVSIYCEREQTAKVESMFATHPPKREWVGLTDEERHEIREWQRIQEELGPVWSPMMMYLYLAIEAKLKEKNT